MKYADIKNILYKSIEIQQIPDKWDESIPFFCKINKEDFVAFLYWTVSSTLLIKRLIGVNRNTGEIIVLEANDLSKLFGLSYGAIKPVIIDDYEKYFSAKMQYEKLFAKYVMIVERLPNMGRKLCYYSNKLLELNCLNRYLLK